MARLSPRAAPRRLGVALWLTALALALAAVTAWVVGEIEAGNAEDRIQARLTASLGAAAAEFDRALDDLEARAARLAASPQAQRALVEGDSKTLTETAAAGEIAAGEIAFYREGTLLAGSVSSPARRSVTIEADDGSALGRVVAGLPLDAALAARLRGAAAFPPDESLALVRRGAVVAGSLPTRDEALLRSAPLLTGADVRVLVAAPTTGVDDERREARRRGFLAALLTLALLALLGWTGIALLRPRSTAEAPLEQPRRVGEIPAREERRAREAAGLVGEALAATHDPDALLPVILGSAMSATGAVGARLVHDGRELARSGTPERGGAPLALRLGTEEERAGLLLLYPPEGSSFESEEGELAHWLVGQASIALENARLHRAVEQQATTDGLTGLANRRRFDESLAQELRRTERFGNPVAVVLADLDDFKLINDRFGHQAGDDVLRRFADVLRASVREIDLPARYGGEEFAVLLPDTDVDGAEHLADRLAERFNGLVLRDLVLGDVSVTASFGVAAAPSGRVPAELLAAADRALYRAKAEGKSRVARATD